MSWVSMTKQEILQRLLETQAAYESDWKNEQKWQAYKQAWKEWRQVKGDQ